MSESKPTTDLAVRSTRELILSDPFMPSSMEELKQFGEMIANSAFAPKDFKGKAAECSIAILYGRELGISPLQALQGVAVINGRPGVYGDLFWALILAHPDFEDLKETSTSESATVEIKRRGRNWIKSTFTKADAQKAGLWGKQGPWTNYPERMLLWRARTFSGRTAFADALKGLTSVEELRDYDYIEGEVVHRETPAAAVETMRKEGEAQQAVVTEASASVSEDQVKELTAAYKASGWKSSDVRDKMKELYGDKVDRTGLIPANRFPEILAWAKTKKGEAAPAPAAKAAEQETPFDEPAEVTPDEKNARQAFGILGFNLFEQSKWIDRFTSDGVTNWTALFKEVGKELPE